MAQVKPIIHGRDHLPGGADPIPRPAPDIEFLESSYVTITSLGVGTMDWIHTAGSVLLDLASPTAPTVIETGVYAVLAQLSPFGSWNADRSMQVVFTLSGSFLASALAQGDARNELLNWSAIVPARQMTAGQSIALTVANRDTVSRDVIANPIIVQKLFSY